MLETKHSLASFVNKCRCWILQTCRTVSYAMGVISFQTFVHNGGAQLMKTHIKIKLYFIELKRKKGLLKAKPVDTLFYLVISLVRVKKSFDSELM